MSTSHPESPPESNKTPSGPTRPAMDGLHVEFSPPGRDASPAPDLASGAVLCNRYRIDRSLGKGGFGGVYLALDLDLGRKVAIKRQLGRHLQDNELARNEAKFIAGLDHPSIVKVFDLIDDEKEGVLIIMEYVNGYTLHELLRRKRLSESRALELAAEIAQSLIHAHSRRIIHRDLKPSNVLLDPAEKVKLSDFGLALGAINYETAPSAAGTPKYMAPEQIRGESHRIDGRTDIWSLGVILYEMLTGSLPFTGPSRGATFESILHDEPTPPRQLNPRIPESLEHIVMRCLRKRMSERPVSASDLLDDLRACQSAAASIEVDTGFVGQPTALDAPDSRTPRSAHSASPSGMLRVEPKGLRPYSEEDGVHFLELIPGPRERSGLPESIHFWRKWASCDNVDEYASVGVLYGPSGAGKTSFVRAGLINQLDNDICPIVIECRSGDLARRIESAIRNRFHQKPQSGSLSKLLSGLRNEEGGIFGYRKILLILDQFESWSTSATTEDRRALAEALRHCDGKTLQSLFVVRDDYWSGITEIMQWIDVPLVENRNVRSLELLDPRHAQRVLEGMGRAHGTLPRAPEPLSDEQQKFIRQAVEGMSNNDRVVAVHLVMFAQIVRVLPWTPQVLRKQGGVEGACSAYLHEIFETSSGPPAYRRISGVVADILSELLPAQGDPLRASAKSIDDLRARVLSGGAGAKVTEAVRVLSEDLKLITPTRGDAAGDSISGGGAEGYQLAHDFLVEPVRNWVELARKSTWRGRAVARLIELSELWQRRPQTQFLPTLREYAAMQFVVPSSSRNDKQTKYLRAAGRYHAGKAAGMTIATMVAVFFAAMALDQYSKRASADQAKRYAQVSQFVHGRVSEVPRLLDELGQDPRYLPMASALLQNTKDPSAQLRSGLLAYRLGKADFTPIAGALEHGEPELFDSLLKSSNAEDAKAVLRSLSDDLTAPQSRRARAAILLLYLSDDQPIKKMLSFTEDCALPNEIVVGALKWRRDHAAWVSLLNPNADPGINYHAIAVLSYFRKEQLEENFPWQRIRELQDSENPGTAQAASWLLRRNQIDVRSSESKPINSTRLRTQMGLELQQIAAGKNLRPLPNGKPQTLELPNPIWVSIGPIERRIYDQFVDDQKIGIDGRPLQTPVNIRQLTDEIQNAPDRPICNIDFNHAVQLVNWLSRKENLTAVYETDGVQTVRSFNGLVSEIPRWKRNPTANGYRFPTKVEMRYLTFAGVSNGVPWQILDGIEPPRPDVDQMQWRTSRHSREVMPSRFGLFCYDVDFSFWLDTPSLAPHTIQMTARSFLDVPSGFPGPHPVCTVFVLRNCEL